MPIDGDRREKIQKNPDILVRWGGDEAVIVCPNITPDGLTALSERMSGSFSLRAAIENYNAGRAPLMASVGASHSASTHTILSSIEHPKPNDYKSAVEQMIDYADSRQEEARERQIAEIYVEAARIAQKKGEATPTKPSDGRINIEVLRLLFPDFMNNALVILTQSLINGPEPE
jgi:GGDEF domain-containing protein